MGRSAAFGWVMAALYVPAARRPWRSAPVGRTAVGAGRPAKRPAGRCGGAGAEEVTMKLSLGCRREIRVLIWRRSLKLAHFAPAVPPPETGGETASNLVSSGGIQAPHASRA